MVTIDPDKPMFSVPANVTEAHPTRQRQGRFDAILKKSVQEATAADVRPQPGRFSSEIPPVQLRPDSMPVTSTIVDHVDRLVDTLAAYQEKLASDTTTLREIGPLVEKLVSQNASLADVSRQMEGNETLRTIVDQSLMLSTAEIARFNNGEYNEG